jgi:uncharacterized protein YyaL (SSP411 family)
MQDQERIPWTKWGKAPFEAAGKDDKPILVYVYANWSHWCHVVDRDVFGEQSVAALVNTEVIPVKVDRDEYPEVDRIFQSAIGGGYPLISLITSDDKILYTANFIQPADSRSSPGFKTVLKHLIQLWKEDRQSLLNRSRQLKRGRDSHSKAELSASITETAVVDMLTRFDWDTGGMGSKTKFPHPMVDQFFMAYSARTGDELGIQATGITLNRMYYGGIMDQIGGGFHRYADDSWYVPGFEKLLTLNGEILSDYFSYWLITRDAEAYDALTFTGDYIIRELTLDYGFAVSQDSDSEDREGRYYTWAPKEVDDAVGKLAGAAKRIFDIKPIAVSVEQVAAGPPVAGVVDGRIVPRRLVGPDELGPLLGQAPESAWSTYLRIRTLMREYRESTRKKPAIDTNRYTHPNCVAAEALLISGYALGREKWISSSLGVLEKLGRTVTRRLDGGRSGLLEDYASALNCAISGYEVTGLTKYLDLARSLADQVRGFLGAEGFVDAGGDVPILDTPEEAPNSQAFRALFRAHLLLPDEVKWEQFQEPFGQTLGAALISKQEYVSSVYRIADAISNGVCTITVVGNDGLARDLHRQSFLTYYPLKSIRILETESLARDEAASAYLGSVQQGSFANIRFGQRSFTVNDPAKIQEVVRSHLIKSENRHDV